MKEVGVETRIQIEIFVDHSILLSHMNFLLELQKTENFRTGQWYMKINPTKAYEIDERKETVFCAGATLVNQTKIPALTEVFSL